jgi:serine/threonine protein kinase
MNGRGQQWGLEIARAVNDLHLNKKTHMDLKPRNLVIDENWHMVLIDISGIGGTTREWLLPELVDASEECFKDWEIQVRSDTWALGKILSLIAASCHGTERLLLIEIAELVERTGGRVPLIEIIHRLA